MTPLGIGALLFAVIAVSQQPQGSARAVASLVGSVAVFADSLAGDEQFAPAETRKGHR